MKPIPIELIAAVPWHKLNKEQKARAWRDLEDQAAGIEADYFNGDTDRIDSRQRYEIGE